MKHLQILILTLMTISLCQGAETEADFYVSTTGSDDWSGTLDEPNATASDGPFATLARARDAVRDLNQQNPKDMVVLVREGTYPLKETVVFGMEDSGVG